MLATDHSSSEESIQSYFARIIKGREVEETNEGEPSKALSPVKESDSSPITVTPAGNLAQGGLVLLALPSSDHAHNSLMGPKESRTEGPTKGLDLEVRLRQALISRLKLLRSPQFR